jgi:hypothetical protein
MTEETCELIVEAPTKEEAMHLFKTGQAYGNGYEVINSDPSESHHEEIKEL